MGRKKGTPTRVLSARITEAEYRRIQEIARRSCKSVSQIYREMIRKSKNHMS